MGQILIPDLIFELQTATEGSAKLNLAIIETLGIKWSSDEDGQYGPYGIIPKRCRYTESLDAALSLVPKDYRWSVDGPDAEFCGVALLEVGGPGLVVTRGATPAIAVCLAVLELVEVPDATSKQ